MLTYLDRIFAACATVAFFVLGVLIVFEVIARYFFNAPTIWVEEIARLLFVWSVFGGAAFLFQGGAHISVTIVTEHVSAPVQRALYAISLLFALACAAVILYTSAPLALSSFESQKTTGSMFNMPSWLFDAAIPVSMFLIVIRTLHELVSCLRGQDISRLNELKDH
ncbi:hypothetical protein RA28_10090 [Ruegeria sp. ANG-S4]|uniref:TRAP transporter small permease n=1 Tax=Ruegeria sp. ANG-S4 TaxID=1577904 RepID=UPI00057EF515|nr:TRAP transporter small permease [Ruegeria sp. ANG-S4]KIC45983.1 hypothetical protein RA28_10090 [Ruegeria sp. ANG-S4]